MTHEELLAKIDHMWNDDFDYVIEQNRKALRAVVELHKPDWSNNNQGLSCAAHYMLTDYPCQTIQVITDQLL